jgi:deoxyribonuclease V
VKAAVDVAYADAGARVAAVLFGGWDAEAPTVEKVRDLGGEAALPYEPGAFYKRELPCLLAVLEELPRPIECVVIDGYVWLGPERPGLGARLHEAVKLPVVGVAKTEFRGAPAVQVVRGESKRPLFVTAVGVDVAAAAEAVGRMHGVYRVPTLLRRVDQLARGIG